MMSASRLHLAVFENLKPLGMWERVTARINHTDSSKWIDFAMCNDGSCNLVAVRGSAPGGRLRSDSWSGCANHAVGCSADGSYKVRGEG